MERMSHTRTSLQFLKLLKPSSPKKQSWMEGSCFKGKNGYPDIIRSRNKCFEEPNVLEIEFSPSIEGMGLVQHFSRLSKGSESPLAAQQVIPRNAGQGSG